MKLVIAYRSYFKTLWKYKIFVFLTYSLCFLLSWNLYGTLFLHSASDIASVRRLTYAQLAQVIEDLSGRWEVTFLNTEEYHKIVRALEVENAILLYETPFWITRVFNHASDPDQILEEHVDYNREKDHSIALYPKGLAYHPLGDLYFNGFRFSSLENIQSPIQDDFSFNIEHVPDFNPSPILREKGFMNEYRISLSTLLIQLLEQENIPQGQPITLYLKDYDIQRNHLQIGIMTHNRHITWTLERHLKIDVQAYHLSSLYPALAFQKIREQIPLAFHEAAHELVRRVLLSQVTDPVYVTVFPKLIFSEDNKWSVSSGSTYFIREDMENTSPSDSSSSPLSSLRNRRYTLSYMAQYLVGVIMDEVFIPDKAQETSNWDHRMALTFAYNGLICGSSSYTCPPDPSHSYFVEHFIEKLSPYNRQSVESTVDEWMEYALFLARHTIVNHLDTLKHLTISILTRNMMDSSTLRDFYQLHPIETALSSEDSNNLTAEQIRADDFPLQLKRILKPIVREISDTVIQYNSQNLYLVSTPQIPLADYPSYLSKRHRIRLRSIDDLLLQTWIENIEFFNECLFCAYPEVLNFAENRENRHRSNTNFQINRMNPSASIFDRWNIHR